MRIYYFGELISDTNLDTKAPATNTPAETKKISSEPRLIRDILTERPYAQRSTTVSRRSRTFGPSFLPTTFTIRNFSHA